MIDQDRFQNTFHNGSF